MAVNPSTAALSMAISKGVTEGLSPLLSAIAGNSSKSHDLRNLVQVNTDKMYSLDGEVKLLKGFVVSLMGTGDGSSGSVPSLQKDVRLMGEDMSTLKSDVRDLRGDIRTIGEDLKAIRQAQANQDALTNKASGGLVAGRWLIGTFVTLILMIISTVVYLFSHGVKP
jgi:hypothetical protein